MSECCCDIWEGDENIWICLSQFLVPGHEVESWSGKSQFMQQFRDVVSENENIASSFSIQIIDVSIATGKLSLSINVLTLRGEGL